MSDSPASVSEDCGRDLIVSSWKSPQKCVAWQLGLYLEELLIILLSFSVASDYMLIPGLWTFAFPTFVMYKFRGTSWPLCWILSCSYICTDSVIEFFLDLECSGHSITIRRAGRLFSLLFMLYLLLLCTFHFLEIFTHSL